MIYIISISQYIPYECTTWSNVLAFKSKDDAEYFQLEIQEKVIEYRKEIKEFFETRQALKKPYIDKIRKQSATQKDISEYTALKLEESKLQYKIGEGLFEGLNINPNEWDISEDIDVNIEEMELK